MNTTAQSNAAAKREAWGRLRKLPSGRWQVRYPGPDGTTYTARTDQDRPLTFLTKTDARTWLAGVQSKMARGLWEPPEEIAARLQAELEIEQVRDGFVIGDPRWSYWLSAASNALGRSSGLVSSSCFPSRKKVGVPETFSARPALKSFSTRSCVAGSATALS